MSARLPRLIFLAVAAIAILAGAVLASRSLTVDQWAVGDHKISCGSVLSPSTAHAEQADGVLAKLAALQDNPSLSDPALSYAGQCQRAQASQGSVAAIVAAIGVLAVLGAGFAPAFARSGETLRQPRG